MRFLGTPTTAWHPVHYHSTPTSNTSFLKCCNLGPAVANHRLSFPPKLISTNPQKENLYPQRTRQRKLPLCSQGSSQAANITIEIRPEFSTQFKEPVNPTQTHTRTQARTEARTELKLISESVGSPCVPKRADQPRVRS